MANRFCLSDAMGERIAPLLSDPPPRDPRKGGRPRTDDRRCMDVIFFRLRTGCQLNALNAIVPERLEPDREHPQGLYLDKGYNDDTLREWARPVAW
jgi:transposase